LKGLRKIVSEICGKSHHDLIKQGNIKPISVIFEKVANKVTETGFLASGFKIKNKKK